jgi:hypothetical protein
VKFYLTLGTSAALSMLSACASAPFESSQNLAATVSQTQASLAGQVSDTDAYLRAKAEILAMPKVQTGVILSSPATDSARVGIAPPPPILVAPLGQNIPPVDPPIDDDWDYDQVREWRVRLPNGKDYSIHQALPRLMIGQEVMIIRYADKLAIAP